jgi:hypothetical protein
MRARITAGALIASLLSGGALATEGGTGAYLLGSRDTLSGIVPPSGTYFSVDEFYMNGAVNFAALGGVVLSEMDTSLWITKLNLTHSWTGDILGGRPAVTVMVPVVSGELSFRGNLINTALNRGFKDDDTGFGDITITPMLGWDEGHHHYSFALSLFLPTGYYEKARVDLPSLQVQALSFGKNRFAVDPTFSYTYLNPDNGREFSAALGVTFSAENDDTNYKTAPEMHLEVAALQHLPNGLAVGAQGYWYQQTGDDSGAGADQIKALTGASKLEARVFGIGPMVTYRTKVGEHTVSAKLKYVHEFGAERRLESDVISLSVAFSF